MVKSRKTTKDKHENAASDELQTKGTPISHQQANSPELAANGLTVPSKDEDFQVPDGGWGWLVCVTAFWAIGHVCGITNCVSIIFVELLDEFDAQKNNDLYYKLAWICSLQVSSVFMLSIFSSVLVDTLGIQLVAAVGAAICSLSMLISSFVYSYQVLYFTYGIMFGFGGALMFTPALAILTHYFDKKLAFVNGLVCLGSAVITVTLGFALPALIEKIDLRNTMRVLCGICAILIVCPLIWKPIRPREKADSLAQDGASPGKLSLCFQKLKAACNTSIFKNADYNVWLLGVSLGSGADYMVLIHMVNFAKEMFPGYNSEILVICLGAVSGISRVGAGRLGDVPGINRVWIQQSSFSLLGIMASIFPFAKNFVLLVVLTCFVGISDGCLICPLGPVAYDLLGPTGVGPGLGVLFAVIGVSLTCAPPFAGFLRSSTGSYTIPFLVAGMISFAGSLTLFLMPSNLYKKKATIEDQGPNNSRSDVNHEVLIHEKIQARLRSDTLDSLASFHSKHSIH